MYFCTKHRKVWETLQKRAFFPKKGRIPRRNFLTETEVFTRREKKGGLYRKPEEGKGRLGETPSRGAPGELFPPGGGRDPGEEVRSDPPLTGGKEGAKLTAALLPPEKRGGFPFFQ